MRIAILTQPLRYNYGGILQNFALQTVLRRKGHEVVTLDPQRCHYRKWQYPQYTFFIKWNDFQQKKLEGRKLSKDDYILYTLQRIFNRLFFRRLKGDILYKKKGDIVIRTLGENLFPFVDHHIKRREYTDLYNDIASNDYDAFIVGSDQVWRPEYNAIIENMFLDFTKGWNVKRIAYAASFGIDSWGGDAETTEICKRMLKQFDFVSVRESSGVRLCQDVFDVNAAHVLDPTMLLTKEEYCSLLRLDKIPKSQGNLLVYILDYSDDKRTLIQRIADEYHLSPFRVNSDVEDYHLSDLSRRVQPPVEQWLRGFYDAEYVVTDSFHACVFSIIFSKPFVVYANDSRGKTRYESLLQQFSLSNCMVTSSEGLHGFSGFTDENKKKLDEQREKSINDLLISLAHVDFTA